MSRWGRRLLLAAAALIALAAGAAVAIALLVDVNRYRPQIASLAQEATGRPVHLGALSLRLLPSPSVAVRPLRLADSAAYPGRDALRADGLAIRVSLPALLRGRLVVRSIVLENPTLTLIRDASGRWNFADLIERASAAGAGRGAAPGGPGVAVEKALIRSGRVLVYDDFVLPGERARADLRPIDAVVTGFGPGGGATLSLSIGLGGSTLRAEARLEPGEGAPLLKVRARSAGLGAADLAGLLPWLGVLSPPGLRVGGSLDVDGEAEIPVDHPETLSFKGRVRLADLSYRDATMARSLERIGGTLSVDGRRAVWEGFALRAGASSLAGRLQVEDFRRPRIGFALTSPRLDFNELIATFGPAPGAADRGRPPAAALPEAGAPEGLLDGMNGRGTLTVEEVRFQTFDLRDVKASVALSGGVLEMREMRAGFYGGALGGTARVALASAVPAYDLGVRLEAVDVAPLLEAYDPGLKGLLQGRLTGRLDLAAAGVSRDAILGSVRGTGSLELTEGVLTSVDVLRQLAVLLEMAGGKGIGKDRTPFESLRASMRVEDRKARTEDLLLRSTDLDLEGKGWVGLDASLNLDATARFSEESTRGMVEKNAGLGRLTEAGRLAVYFNLSGGLGDPKFRLDTRAQARQARETAREKAKERARDRLRDRILKHLEEPAPEAP
jgi:AsmA protein